jgi:hypothetical protein
MRPGYDWDEAFEAALLGPDRWKVNAAQAAIDRRLQEMNADRFASRAICDSNRAGRSQCLA